MPYWISQSKGPLVDKIRELCNLYKTEPEKAYNQLRELYIAERGEPRSLKLKKYDEVTNPDYMVRLWFPMYINMPWSDGTRAQAERMKYVYERRNPGTEYLVNWEY